MAKKITKAAIDNLKAPESGEVSIWDSELEGFGVRCQKGGKKVYVIRYRAPDAKRTQRKMVLARCSDVPPDKARELARKEFAKIADGHDPVAEKRPQPAVAKAKLPTVEALFEGYVASMRAKSQASADEVERALLKAGNNAADALGRHKEAREVTASDIVEYVASLFDNGTRGAADKHRGYIASAFAWGITSTNDYTVKNRQNWGVTHNPATDVAKDSGAKNTRDRNLSAAEVRIVWEATDLDAGKFASQEIAACIRLLICCGQRVQETLRIDGCEIDLQNRVWNMPAHKTKGGKYPHDVPLPDQALPILRDLKMMYGDGPLFPLKKDGSEGIIDYREVGRAIKRWMGKKGVPGIERFQTRDLRRTWKSRAHDAGVDRFTRDLIQQHAMGDTGSKHYDRAVYYPQMRAAMDKWAVWLADVIDGKVVAGPWEAKIAA